MMLKTPSISAIVPVHNGAAYVGDALRSIRAQTEPVLEVIVVNDGSTDGTAAAVAAADPDAIIIHQPQGGPARARNAGALQAKGEWLAYLDHDDIWPPERTNALLERSRAVPGAGLICGRFRLEEMPGSVPDPRLRRADGTHVPFLFPAGLVRREIWQAMGGMDPAHERSEDLDLYLRMIDAGVETAMVEAITLVYRQHGGNRSRAATLASDALLATLRATIKRRRALME